MFSGSAVRGSQREPSSFDLDLRKFQHIALGDAPDQRARVALWLTNSELHCVACYRFGQFAYRLRQQHRRAGAVAVAWHRVWNRWVTHIDHCELSGGARIGPAFLLMHRHGVMIGPVEIGKNCVIHQNVTIGQRVAAGDQRVPTIGDNVWIGPGATIVGGISIGDGVTISAGTVISKDVPSGCLIGGNPGRVLIRDYDNSALINYQVPGGPASDVVG